MTRPTGEPAQLFVSVSHVRAAPDGSAPLEEAFADRLHEVEDAPGFVRLEVWRDLTTDDRYAMVTWWATEEHFRGYLRSDAHRRSHARMPGGPLRPRGAGLDRYVRVSM
jgi:heme-degrading monooxygenase HmoA